MLRTCGRVVGHKTCGHSGYSDFSPLPSWPRIEGGDPGGISWTYWGWSSPRGFLFWTSCQSPRPPCVCWETSVRRALWRKQKHMCCSPFVVKIQILLLPAYLHCMSANLWCNIPSGVADADHHHPLPPEGRAVFVIPAVNARARKCVMSWRRKHDVYVLVFMKPAGQFEISSISALCPNLGSQTAAAMEGRIGPNTPELHQRRVSPPVRPCQWSQRPTDRKQRNRAFVRLSSPWSEIYFQCKHYTVPELSLMIVMWAKTNLKPDVSVQVEVIRKQPEILQQLWIVQVVWILSRHWKITEAHDLFGGVGHQGAVDTDLVRFCGLLRIEWESQG